MLTSRVHHCISQEYVSQGIADPPAVKCRCRKFIPIAKATEMVKNGEARWVVTKRTPDYKEITCRLCKGDKTVKACASCKDTRVETVNKPYEEYSNDIVRVSRLAVNPKEKKYRPALAMKTPRVATIESKHIVRAYVNDNEKEAEAAKIRIEEYGALILKARIFVRTGKYPTIMMRFEPENNREKGEGRDYDYGRTI